MNNEHNRTDYLLRKLGDYEVVFSRQYPYKSSELAYTVEIYDAGTVGIKGSLVMAMSHNSSIEALERVCANIGVV